MTQQPPTSCHQTIHQPGRKAYLADFFCCPRSVSHTNLSGRSVRSFVVAKMLVFLEEKAKLLLELLLVICFVSYLDDSLNVSIKWFTGTLCCGYLLVLASTQTALPSLCSMLYVLRSDAHCHMFETEIEAKQRKKTTNFQTQNPQELASAKPKKKKQPQQKGHPPPPTSPSSFFPKPQTPLPVLYFGVFAKELRCPSPTASPPSEAQRPKSGHKGGGFLKRRIGAEMIWATVESSFPFFSTAFSSHW